MCNDGENDINGGEYETATSAVTSSCIARPFSDCIIKRRTLPAHCQAASETVFVCVHLHLQDIHYLANEYRSTHNSLFDLLTHILLLITVQTTAAEWGLGTISKSNTRVDDSNLYQYGKILALYHLHHYHLYWQCLIDPEPILPRCFA